MRLKDAKLHQHSAQSEAPRREQCTHHACGLKAQYIAYTPNIMPKALNRVLTARKRSATCGSKSLPYST